MTPATIPPAALRPLTPVPTGSGPADRKRPYAPPRLTRQGRLATRTAVGTDTDSILPT